MRSLNTDQEIVARPFGSEPPDINVISGSWLRYHNEEEGYSIYYPSKIYYDWNAEVKWFDVFIKKSETDAIVTSSYPLHSNLWNIHSVKNISEKDLDTWAQISFGPSCTTKTIKNNDGTLEVLLVDIDPNANVMTSNCRGAFTALRVVYQPERRQIIWWDMGQEAIFTGPDGRYYDEAMAKSFRFEP